MTKSKSIETPANAGAGVPETTSGGRGVRQKAARSERLAAELRANLKRRKAAARGRAADMAQLEGAPTKGSAESDDQG